MTVAGFRSLDFDVFHREELPERLAAGNGAVAARAAQALGSLGFQLPDGRAWSYEPRDGGIVIRADAGDATTVMALGHDEWEGLVHDYESAPGLLYGGRVRCPRGNAMRFVLWEPALRAMYTGRPVFVPEEADLRDRHGEPLDVGRSFRLDDDDPEDMAHFLRTAGYLCVRGLFDEGEVAAFRAEALELRSEAVKGDKVSWWARGPQGEELCCRVTRAAEKPGLGTLKSDPRIERLAALSGETLERRDGEGSGVTCIYKLPGMTAGLADLPWHRDCGMGGHALMCPVYLCSVYLTHGNADSGELRFLPGSHRGTYGFQEASSPRAPVGAGFRAQPGDATLHCGDVMHAAPSPARRDLDAYRISAVTGFSRPDARNHLGEQSYNAVLHQRDDGQVEHLAKVAERA
jgi:hypothetical protein